MKTVFRPIATMLAAALALGSAAPAAAHDDDDLGPETRREIGAARQGTARYHDIAAAIEDGYVDIDVFIPNMGFHYLKPELLDATFEPDRPELLVYAVGPNGRLRLVAVEYAVPLPLSADAPEGFTGDADHWHAAEEFGLWTLHAWVWLKNPDGIFAELNSRVP